MVTAVAFILFASLAGEPLVGVHRADASDFDFEHASMSPCVPKISAGIDPKFAAECERLSEPQYFHGVWRAEFEVSNFTFMGRKSCFEALDNSCILLTGEALPSLGRWACSREFEVEFIGRRSKYAVMEHGFPEYLVVAERLISAKRLPDPYNEDCDPNLHPELKAQQ